MTQSDLAAGTVRHPSPPARASALCLLALVLAACGSRSPDLVHEPEPPPVEASPIDLIESVVETIETAPAPSPVEIPSHLGDVLAPGDIREEFGHMFALETADSVPEPLYHSVLKWVEFFQGRARGSYATWLAREGRWGPMIRSELQQAGLPEDLVYLAMIESGFGNAAVSRARAVGMWQFMAPTARDVGLRVDDWVDERRDPVKSTRGAIRYLRWLHDQTGSWALTAAAYNAGLGRVTRIQRDAGETDYFRLVAAGRLPEETRRYVPTILAAALIAHNRERFGFGDVQPQEPFAHDTVRVEGFTLLSAVATAAGTREAVIRELNPHLIRNVVPPGPGLAVRVPVGTLPDEFRRKLAAIPASKRFMPREVWTTVAYTVRSGDSWWRIASRHKTTVSALRKLNEGVPETLHPGMTVKVRKLQKVYADGIPAEAVAAGEPAARTEAPESAARSEAAESSPAEAPAPSNATESRAAPAKATESRAAESRATESKSAPTKAPARSAAIHVVRPGETLSGLAVRYGVSTRDLAEWNGMKEPRGLRIGEKLRIAREIPTTHKVEPGETMTGLALRYDLTLERLARWNGMEEPRGLRAGEVLRLVPPDPTVHTVAAGETMEGLARRYGVRVRDLAEWNGMKEPRGLRIGEKLVVNEPEQR